MSPEMLVFPLAARMAGQCSKPEKIRKRMSFHKPSQIRCLRQFVSDMLAHPSIPKAKESTLANHLMSTCRQKIPLPDRMKSMELDRQPAHKRRSLMECRNGVRTTRFPNHCEFGNQIAPSLSLSTARTAFIRNVIVEKALRKVSLVFPSAAVPGTASRTRLAPEG